jgi:hypothetical protein
MKLYVCWGTFSSPRPGGHPCGNAYHALRDAGYDPEVKKVYGLGLLPDITSGRREVTRLSGKSWVPVLVTDDGDVISESKNIVAWATAHPAGAAAQPQAGETAA